MKNDIHPRIIIVIGIANLLLLLYFTPLLNYGELVRADPLFFAWPAILLIGLWGLAYIAVARIWRTVPLLLLVFALEKVLYAWHWAAWLGANGERMQFLQSRDTLTAVFMGGYGLWDGACALYFLFLLVLALRSRS